MATRLLLLMFMLTPVVACQERGGPAHLTSFEENGKWGYRDDRGFVVIQPQFEMAQEFSKGIAAVVDSEGWAYINTRGKVLLRPLVVDNGPDDFSEGLARFRQEGKIGFFDVSGRPVIIPTFDFARPFSEGLAAFCEACKEIPEDEHRVIKGGKWGFIDRKGDATIPAKFDEAESFREGRARVKVDGQWGYIDKKGQTTMDYAFEFTEQPQEAVFIVSYAWTGGMGEAVLDPETGALRSYKDSPIFIDSEFVREQLKGKLPDHWTGSMHVRLAARIKLVKRTERNPSIPGAPRETFWKVQIIKLHEIGILN